MKCIGSRYLLFGGKTTFGDLWWLVPEDDPIANRLSTSPPRKNPENNDAAMSSNALQSRIKGNGHRESALSELQKLPEISLSMSSPEIPIVDELEDKEFLELASLLTRKAVTHKESTSHIHACLMYFLTCIFPGVEAVRDHWRKSKPQSIALKELSPLFRDYQRLVERHHIAKVGPKMQNLESNFPVKEVYRFYHLRNSSQLRMDDIPALLAEYKQLSNGKD